MSRSLEVRTQDRPKVPRSLVLVPSAWGIIMTFSGFGFVTMVDSGAVEKILSQAVHVVDCRSIRVSLTHTVKNHDWEPPKNFEKNYAKRETDRIELLNEVNNIDVREGRLYVGALPFNVSPNILADHFSSYGIVAHSDVSRAEQNIWSVAELQFIKYFME